MSMPVFKRVVPRDLHARTTPPLKAGVIGTLTCPECRQAHRLEIPIDRCLHFYTCPGCKTLVESQGCCVFCDYGDTRCPADTIVRPFRKTWT